MKKLLSILISLAMIFTLFTAFAVQAEDELTGTINIPELAESVPNDQQIFVKFSRPLTKSDTIKVSGYSTPAKNDSSDPWKNVTFATNTSTQRTMGYELSEDGMYLRIFPKKNDAEYPLNIASTSENGNVWRMIVKVNDVEITRVNFHSQGQKQAPSSTTFPTSGTVPCDQTFLITFPARPYWSNRNEVIETVIHDGEKYLTKTEEFKTSYTSNKFTITPVANSNTEWAPGKTYTVFLKLMTKSTYDKDGNVLPDPKVLYQTKSWTFTTEAEDLPAEHIKGVFNVPDKAQSIAKETELFFVFDTPLTTEEQSKITATIDYRQGTLSRGDAFNEVGGKNAIDDSLFNKSTNVKLDWYDNGKALKITRLNSEGATYSDPWYGDPSYGRAWKVVVKYNKTELGKVRFAVSTPIKEAASNPLKLDATSAFVSGSEITDRTSTFLYSTSANAFPAKEIISAEMFENGKPYTEFEFQTAANTTGLSYSQMKIVPAASNNRWGIAKKYDVVYKICSPKYAMYPDENNNPVVEEYVPLFETSWSFTTEGYDPNAPEEPEEPEVPVATQPEVTYENGVATIANNTAKNVSDAILILAAKDSTTKLITNIFVNNVFALDSTKSTTVNFALAEGEEFDFFLLDSKLAPIINK